MLCPEADAELLRRFRTGDRAALSRVYRHHAPGVIRLLRHGFSFRSDGRACRFGGCRSRFDLEDRLHQTFERAFRPEARARYDGIHPYEHFLLTIAKNLVIDEFRRKEHALLEFTSEPLEPPDSFGSEVDTLGGSADLSGRPELDAEAQELIRLVQVFKTQLPERERRVFLLRYEDGLDHPQIQARTGLSPSRIKTSERRIRQRFFAYMKAKGYFEGRAVDGAGWVRWASAEESSR
ncbi:MAG: RNA polymerase sigma factor [Myxococcota bacterium]